MGSRRNERSRAATALPRGYFGIGAERISKSLNLGNLMRSAHGFGASFTFTIGATYQALEARADTSKGAQHLPHYDWASVSELALPQGCRLVGVELLDEAIDLPSFHHPLRAAYVLGPEQGALSPALLARCDHVVRIPYELLHQRGHGRRDRHVRPRTLAGTISASTDRRRRADKRQASSPATQDWPARRLAN